MEFSHQDVRKKFIELFQQEPLLVRSPARINLIGEHTDYNEGFVMPAAIDKEIVFAIAPSSGAISRIFSMNFQDQVEIQLDHDERVQQPSWLNYLLGIVHQFNKRGYTIKTFNCVIGGNIPTGAGMSSSAALECGFVFALDMLNDLKLSKVDMIKMAQWSEHHYAGVKCGIMDQFSSMMGKEDHVFVLDCRSLAYQYFPIILKNHTIVLLDSSVKHSLADSEYNTRRKECEEGIAILQKFYPSIASLRDVTPAMLTAYGDRLSETVYNRCAYVVNEIERVLEASHDLEKGDIRQFGGRMYETHEGLSKLYAVSCKELDFLVQEAKKSEDVVGARMMGGGFGGCTINIVESDKVEPFIKQTRENYRNFFYIDLPSYVVKIKDGTSTITAEQ